MLESLLNQAKNNQGQTGKHINYEISKAASKLSIDEIESVANETGNKRMLRQVELYRDGTHAKGEAEHLNRLRIMVEGQISSLNIQTK